MSVFQQVIGKNFSRLPLLLQRIHGEQSKLVLRGRCDVQRGKGFLIRLAARVVSLPSSGANVPLTVTIKRDALRETWTRNFGGHEMRSCLWTQRHLLAEQLGLVTLLFLLTEQNGKIQWSLHGARIGCVPLPKNWFSKSRATEQCMGDRYMFDVSAELPLLGLLVRYHGWLSEHE